MADLQEEDFRIAVCTNAHKPVQWYITEPVPAITHCETCGAPLIFRCTNPSCPNPGFLPRHLEANHHSCGTVIPWAESRNLSVATQRQATLERLAAKKRGEPPWTEEERRVAMDKRTVVPIEATRAEVPRSPLGKRILIGIGTFLFGGLQNVVGTVIGALLLAWLIAAKFVNLPQ